MATSNIWKLVLTGGPSGGKTLLGNWLAEELRHRRQQAWLVPELATRLFASGVSPSDFQGERNRILREAMIRMRIHEENIWIELANQTPGPVILIFDRGVADEEAYCLNREEYAGILSGLGATRENIWQRYDSVIHLETVAAKSLDLYIRETNLSRVELAEAALISDQRTREAWVGHPECAFINACSEFDCKKAQLWAQTASWLDKRRDEGLATNMPHEALTS